MDSVLIILSLSYNMKEERGRIRVIIITIVCIIVCNTSNMPKLSAASQITPAYKNNNDMINMHNIIHILVCAVSSIHCLLTSSNASLTADAFGVSRGSIPPPGIVQLSG